MIFLSKKNSFFKKKKPTKTFFDENGFRDFFSQKIKSTFLEVKHIQSRASNSSGAARTSHTKNASANPTFFFELYQDLIDFFVN